MSIRWVKRSVSREEHRHSSRKVVSYDLRAGEYVELVAWRKKHEERAAGLERKEGPFHLPPPHFLRKLLRTTRQLRVQLVQNIMVDTKPCELRHQKRRPRRAFFIPFLVKDTGMISYQYHINEGRSAGALRCLSTHR